MMCLPAAAYAMVEKLHRLRRSILCVPANNHNKTAKCRTYGAGQILFDLEDGVPEELKQTAIDNLPNVLRSGDAVRLPTITHPLYKAAYSAVKSCDRRVTLWSPKIEYVDDLGWAFGGVAIIESPRGIRNLHKIITSGFVSGLAFGRYDFMASVGVSDIWSPLVNHAMGEIAMAAHAAGIRVSDAPCYSIDDEDLMRREVDRARGYGFYSKGCIHPKQLAACEGMLPSAAEKAELSRLLDLSGVQFVDGRLVAPPMRRLAEVLLAD